MKDTVYRADAIDVVMKHKISFTVQQDVAREIDALPSADITETDGVITIEKQSAKDVGEIKHVVIHSPNYTRYFYNESMPTSAETHEIRTETHGRLIDADALEKELSKRWDISDDQDFCNKEVWDALRNAPTLSAEAVQGWIPCNKQMPDELEAVNVTWVNHLAPPYYKHIEDVPFVDSAVYYRGKWYWWDATVIDVLAEYGEDCNAEQIDKDIEVIAWMPLPKPYKGGDDE